MLPGPGSHISRACLGQEIVKCCAGRRGSQNGLWHSLLFLPRSSVHFPQPTSILHPKWSLSHIPAANSPGSDPAIFTLVWTVEADTFICPGLSRVSGLPTGGGRVGIHGQPHWTHSVAYCPAEGTGKGHVGVSTIPPQHSLLSTLGGGAGTTSHVTSNRQDTESLKCQASIAQQ